MNSEEKAALREAASKATPGPWSSYATSSAADMPLRWTIAGHGATVARYYADNISFDEAKANAHYIAATNPAAVLALLARLERCEAALRRFVEETSILPSGAIIGLERGHFDDAQAALGDGA